MPPDPGALPPPPALAPKIVCPETVYDFGEQENSQVVGHHYVVRNEGTLSLEIRGVRASCGCTAVKPTDSVVPPGGETTIQARFDLRGRSGMQVKTITVESNDPESPVVHLQIRGTAVQGLRAQPSTLFFGRIEPGAERTRGLKSVRTRAHSNPGSRTTDPGLVVSPLEPEPGADGTRHRFE